MAQVPSVSVKYAANGNSTKPNELGMRAMQERAYEKRGEQYLLIKSPPASGRISRVRSPRRSSQQGGHMPWNRWPHVHGIDGHMRVEYAVQDRKLVVNDAEAASVRRIFERFVEVGSATVLARELRREGFRNKQGTLIDKGYLYRVLNNRVYRGEAMHKGKSYPGEHAAIIDADLWDRAHSILQESPRKRANNSRARTPALLKGLIFYENGAAMTPTSTKKGTKLYRYYVSMDVIRNRETGEETAPMRLAAGMVEDAVVTEVRRILQTPEVVMQVLAALLRDGVGASEADAIAALHEFNALWSQLFPAEQARIIQLLVRRVTVTASGLAVDIRREGIAGVIREMVAPRRVGAAE